MEEATPINWSDFESVWLSMNKGEHYDLVLYNWRQEYRSYDDDKTEKPVIVFDVLKVNGEEFSIGRKKFSTGALSFADEIKPIIKEAERRNKSAIHVRVKYGTDKRYQVIDLSPKEE